MPVSSLRPWVPVCRRGPFRRVSPAAGLAVQVWNGAEPGPAGAYNGSIVNKLNVDLQCRRPAMPAHESDTAVYSRWAGAVEFRLFADLSDPTLSVPEQIAARVGDRIIAGTLAPGARIGEQELADEFKVSRGPVREAIRILEREGLATVLPRRGAVVTALSAHELMELFEVRAGLFEIVLRRVARERPPELLAVLREGVGRLDALAGELDAGDAYAEAVYRLILVTARFAGNERLRRLINAISLQTLRYSKLGLAPVARRLRSAQLWRDSVAALEAGDSARLVQLARQRIEESAGEAARMLASDGEGPAT